MRTVLEVANVEKYYGNKGSLTKALDKISFEVQEGEFVGIMGASGSGKTTLFSPARRLVSRGHWMPPRRYTISFFAMDSG